MKESIEKRCQSVDRKKPNGMWDERGASRKEERTNERTNKKRSKTEERKEYQELNVKIEECMNDRKSKFNNYMKSFFFHCFLINLERAKERGGEKMRKN